MIRGLQIAYFVTPFLPDIRAKNGAFPPLHQCEGRENFADSAVDATFARLIGALWPGAGGPNVPLDAPRPGSSPYARTRKEI
jgi:hypothetical protein